MNGRVMNLACLPMMRINFKFLNIFENGPRNFAHSGQVLPPLGHCEQIFLDRSRFYLKFENPFKHWVCPHIFKFQIKMRTVQENLLTVAWVPSFGPL